MGGKLGGNSCISKISADVIRDALGGKAGDNSDGKSYVSHDVTIVCTGLMVTLKLHCCMIFLESMCTSRELLCSTYTNLSMGGTVRQTVRRFCYGRKWRRFCCKRVAKEATGDRHKLAGIPDPRT